MNTQTILTVEDLKRFCSDSKQSSRVSVTRPFSQGHWTYATDGRVLIRVPRLDEVPEYSDSPRDVEKRIFVEQPVDGLWLAIPSVLPELKPAEKCDECGGKPDADCWQCNGSGFVEPIAIPVQIGKHDVSHIYLHKLRTLPSVEICESAEDDMHALGVRFDGGEGRLMGMRKSGQID